jgi:glutathione S-transferase
LDAHLARHAFLGGDAFTMGDIPAGTSLHRYFEMGVQTPALPHLRAWHARLLERPAFCEHVAVPFDALRGRLSY